MEGEEDFGRRLRALRHMRGETLEQVSEATGLSVAMLSRVERGQRLPSPESAEALARHFGVSAEDLMSETIAYSMLSRYGPLRSTRAAERLWRSSGSAEQTPAGEPEPTPSRSEAAARREDAASGARLAARLSPLAAASMDEAAFSMRRRLADFGVRPEAADREAATLADEPPALASVTPEFEPDFCVTPYARRPIEDLFPSEAMLSHLEDAAHVAEVALESAVNAAWRAVASGDPELRAAGLRVLKRLREAIERKPKREP